MATDTEVGYVGISPRRDSHGRIILPSYCLSVDLGGFGEPAKDLAVKSPTLFQLRHGYENSEQIRRNILGRKGYGEAVRTAIGPAGKKPRGLVVPKGHIVVAYVVPENFEYDDHDWHAEGKSKTITLPAEGWQGADGKVLYDEDGWPVRTYKDKQNAVDSILKAGIVKDEKEAKNLTSYFWRPSEYRDFAAVYRIFWYSGRGPWDLFAYWYPAGGDGDVGFRAVVERPSAEREAEPQN